jgi:hypothetical protein
LFKQKYFSQRETQSSPVEGIVVPRVHFRVQGIAESQVKLVFVCRLEHQAQVVAIGPISLGADLLLHPVEECSARQRIRERDADVIRSRIADQLYRFLNVLPLLSGVAELQEIAGANTRVCQPFRAASTSATRKPLSMASSTRCDPDSTPIQTSAQPARLRLATVSWLIRSARD